MSTSSPDGLLSVSGLDVTVPGGATAVRDVSFTIAPGETVGIVGESGSGKTLVCRSVLGVLPPGVTVAAGSIVLDGTSLTTLNERGWRSVRGRSLSVVFQDPASYLNPSITVGRQLAEQLRRTRAIDRRTSRAAAIDLLTSVGLRRAEVAYGQFPHQLSGGMLQRILIAIAIAGEPKLLVADEATTALDVAVQAEVLDLLAALRRRHRLALLLVSHDLAVVVEVCDRVIVLYAGEVVEDGPTAEVLARPRHPYTEALLRVASLGDWQRRRLEVIPGSPPAPGTAPDGCRFAPRCPYAVDACRAGVIPLTDGVRCVRAADLELVGA
ncbi:MAG TPA: ABC transporter ATP-binding protein [Micromonosporaceae bacterium]|jgi:peptide/nickel transport system ATP-binding protein